MSNFESMSIAEFYLDSEDWGDESDPASDWSLANKHATFSHKEACEFIFYVGDPDAEESTDMIPVWEERGFSKEFLERCREVQKAGFKHVCFYT